MGKNSSATSARLPDDLERVRSTAFELLDLLPRLWHHADPLLDIFDPFHRSAIQAANELPTRLVTMWKSYAPIEAEIGLQGEVLRDLSCVGLPCKAGLDTARDEYRLVAWFANRDHEPTLDDSPDSDLSQAYQKRIDTGQGFPMPETDAAAFNAWMAKWPEIGRRQIDAAKAMVNQQLLRVAAARDAAGRLPPRESDHEERDAFMYRLREEGKTLGWIRQEVANLSTEKKWDTIDYDSGVSAAIDRYATRNKKPKIRLKSMKQAKK